MDKQTIRRLARMKYGCLQTLLKQNNFLQEQNRKVVQELRL
ncbi:hypothetical protein ACFEMT_003605 [Salmonella enterica]